MAGRYVNEDIGENDRPMKVCAEAGRKCVRNIHQYPVLSSEWIALVDSLKQLARLVQLEGRMPVNQKVSEIAGRDKESEGTLWDQESHENAIRILVEEAKVNLCLRILIDFKSWQADDASRRAKIEETMKVYEFTQHQLEQKCIQFEDCMGLLLWKAFTHVETLQLMDIPLLIEYIAQVLTAAQHTTLEDLDARLQETLVLYYFSCLMKHSEALNSREVLARCKELRLFDLAIGHFLSHKDKFSSDLKMSFAEGLAAMADNEDFRTNWEDFFETTEAKQTFLRLEEALTTPIVAEHPEKRKNIRPLLDFLKEIQRSIR